MKCFFLNTHYNPILFEPVIGNTFSCFHFQAVEITWLLIQEISTQTNKCLQNWKLRVPTMTALTALYWQAQVQKHFSDVYLSFECFNICLCDVGCGMYFWSGGTSTELFFFVFFKSGVYDLLSTVWWYFWLEAVYSTTSMNVKFCQILLGMCYMLNSDSRFGGNWLSLC